MTHEHHPRHLTPGPQSPWLQDTSGTRVWRWVLWAGGAMVVASILCGNAVDRHDLTAGTLCVGLLLGGCLLLFFGGAGYGLSHLVQRGTQTCPHCFEPMRRGATRCPACHFDETEAP